MKVAHFITPGGFYGAEQWVLTFLKYFDTDQGVLVCTDKDDLTLYNKAKGLGINTHLIKVKGSHSLKEIITKLSNYMLNENIDILHTHGYKSDIIGYISAKSSNKKIVSTPHGWDLQSGIKVKLYDVLDRFVLRFFDKVVPLSQDLFDSLNHISHKKLVLINNLVDLDGLPKIQKGNFKTVCYIGRLTELKRVNVIIQAISLLPNDIKLQIIGDGPKKTELIQLTSKLNLDDRIQFLGFREDRLELLNQSAILVLASISEGTSRTLMEAMALQRVVIGSNIPGNRNLINDTETGYLFKLNDHKELADIIKNIVDSPLHSDSIAKNGRQYIYESFSAKTVIEKYIDLYKDTLSI